MLAMQVLGRRICTGRPCAACATRFQAKHTLQPGLGLGRVHVLAFLEDDDSVQDLYRHHGHAGMAVPTQLGILCQAC